MKDMCASMDGVNLIAAFSLAWFIVGLIVGRLLPKKVSSATRAASNPRGGRGNGNGRSDRGSASSGAGRKPERKPERTESERDKVELYVGNLPYEMTEAELNKVFSKFGRVVSIRLIENRSNGKSKGFGFIEMGDPAGAQAAIRELNSSKLQGRSIVVSAAKSHEREGR